MRVRRRHIRQLVTDLLKIHRIEHPPVDVRWIIEQYGIVVQTQRVEGEVSGFLLHDRRNKLAIIGVNESHSPKRQRFTMALELCHFLLHSFDEIHVDGPLYSLQRRDAQSSDGTVLHEMEANFFAAELLMPSSFLEEDVSAERGRGLGEDYVVTTLARKYKVSQQAMTIRLTSLGFITDIY
jgi:Zn-dependent peptidase ImmA (M78 family)